MIKFDNVGFRYETGPEILSDIGFELKSGSYHFLTGPSGAGKSSLLSLMFLGHRPTRGSLFMFDSNVGLLPASAFSKSARKSALSFRITA